MAFGPEFLDDIRSRVTLSDVVARRVRLIRRGREHTGLCPFHNEKTPSFTVNDDKAFWHCFGCGAHGDVIGFVMRTEGLSFPEAVERLAGEAGLQVPVASPEERVRAKARETLHGVNEAACAWFEKQLRLPAGRPALDYLKGRGLSDETIARFRLGFAPDSRDALKVALTKQGLSEALLLEAGLVGRPDDGRALYDRFRGRVMFPITDARQRVIAFGGRTIGDGQPKYLNSPDTPLFNKGHVLYGLAAAREAMRNAQEKAQEAVVVEGYMDVIALHQAGIRTAVAPLGTALTEQQIELLWRIAPEPILCFDGDTAGQRAAHRAADRALPLLKAGHSLRIALLPAGDDPDSLVRRVGKPAVQTVLAQAHPLVDLVWDGALAGRALNTPEQRADLWLELRKISAKIADGQIQKEYARELRDRYFEYFRNIREKKFQKRIEKIQLVPTFSVDVLPRRVPEALVLTIFTHPNIIEDIHEDLMSANLHPTEINDVKEVALAFVAQCLATEDKISIKAMFKYIAKFPCNDTLKAIARQRRQIYVHARFARPKATDEAARYGIRHFIRSNYEKTELEAQIRKAEQALALESTDRNFKILQDLLGKRHEWRDSISDKDWDEYNALLEADRTRA